MTFPAPDPSTRVLPSYTLRRLVAVLALVGVVVLAVVGVRSWLHEEPYVPPVEIVQTAPVVLKPFEPQLQTCFGTVTTIMRFDARRENDIPIPFLPDIPWTDDVYYLTAPVQAELCLKGTMESVTTPDALTITVDQRHDIVLNRPAIKALCDDGDRPEDCLSISGHQSNGSVIVGLLPFTSSDDPNLVATMLQAAEVAGSDPTCLSEAMAQPGLGLYEVIYASLEQARLDQGIEQPLVLNLLDASGDPTGSWDARPQRAQYVQREARFRNTVPANYTVDFSSECEISGWGIAGTTPAPVADATTTTIHEPLYPTPTGSTTPNIFSEALNP